MESLVSDTLKCQEKWSLIRGLKYSDLTETKKFSITDKWLLEKRQKVEPYSSIYQEGTVVCSGKLISGGQYSGVSAGEGGCFSGRVVNILW